MIPGCWDLSSLGSQWPVIAGYVPSMLGYFGVSLPVGLGSLLFLSLSLCVYLSIYLCIYLFIHLYIHVYVLVYTYIYMYMSISTKGLQSAGIRVPVRLLPWTAG